MTLSKGTKASIGIGALTLSWFTFMLYFRAYLYAGIYLEPNTAYGIADIIELGLGSLFLVLIALSIILAIGLFIKGSGQSKRSGTCLMALCVALLIAYSPLHNLAAKLGG